MKSICFLISTGCLAVEKTDGEVLNFAIVNIDPIKSGEGNDEQFVFETQVYESECTVSATGMVHSVELGDFGAAVSVIHGVGSMENKKN